MLIDPIRRTPATEYQRCPVPFKCPKCKLRIYWIRIDGHWDPYVGGKLSNEHLCRIHGTEEAGELLK